MPTDRRTWLIKDPSDGKFIDRNWNWCDDADDYCLFTFAEAVQLTRGFTQEIEIIPASEVLVPRDAHARSANNAD